MGYTVLIWWVTVTGVIVLVLVTCSGFGYTFGLSPEAFGALFWICQYMDCVKMGFSKNVYNVMCHYPHRFCLKCTKKCVQNRWTTRDKDTLRSMEMRVTSNGASALEPTKTTTTTDETVSI